VHRIELIGSLLHVIQHLVGADRKGERRLGTPALRRSTTGYFPTGTDLKRLSRRLLRGRELSKTLVATWTNATRP
jgi:hypothetical protein